MKKLAIIIFFAISQILAQSSNNDIIPSGSSNDCWDILKEKTICMSVNFRTHECFGESYKYQLGKYFNIVSKKQWNLHVCINKSDEWLKQNQINEEEHNCMKNMCNSTFNNSK